MLLPTVLSVSLALFAGASGVAAVHQKGHAAHAVLHQRAELFKREYGPGGWSLQPNTNESCPSDTKQCTVGCCPTALTCQDPGDDQVSLCCPDSK
jgi:hypothetical protein